MLQMCFREPLISTTVISDKCNEKLEPLPTSYPSVIKNPINLIFFKTFNFYRIRGRHNRATIALKL